LNENIQVIGIVDPPRPGLHLKTIRAIRACRLINRLIYVSCLQTSLIKDAASLCRSESRSMVGAPFIPVRSVAVDLFPHTEHCELLVEFIRAEVIKEDKNNEKEVKEEVKEEIKEDIKEDVKVEEELILIVNKKQE